MVFVTKHSLSDKATEDLLLFFSTVLPNGNYCPTSLYKLKKDMEPYFTTNTKHYALCPLCHTDLLNGICTNKECDCNKVKEDEKLIFFTMDIGQSLQRITSG